MPARVTEFPNHVRVVENLWVPLPDGTRLAAKVWLPESAWSGEAPVPVVLEYLPYRKRDGTRTRDQGLHMYLAGHGYAGVRLDIRGTGDSEGILTGEYTEQEQSDGVDAIAWLAAQEWCDGQVSMIGISWGGFNGLQIAARRPPALRSVITVGSTDDRYATDVHWIGGCLSKDNFDWSSTMFAAQDAPPCPVIAGPFWREQWQERLEANRPWILDWLAHQRRDAFWQHGSVCEDFSRITVPVYAVSGWADNYSEAVPRLLAGLSGPRLGLIGPWAHSFPQDPAVAPAIGWLQEVVRWCDHWMKGRDTGMMDEPMLRVWMQESAPPLTCYRERAGRWVAEQTWPSERITPRDYFPAPGGRLGDRARPGQTTVCSPLWVGLGAGEIGRYGEEADWPGDQREDDGGSLLFVSAPLEAPLEILGAPLVTLTFASDKPQALVCARLCDIAPDGASTRVTLGLLNLTHRESHAEPKPLVPGETTQAVVEMDDIAHRFSAGHRIGLALSTSYWPIAWPSPELATLTVALGQSRLTLPVRPPRAEDAALRPFGPALAAPDTPYTDLPVEAPPRRRITRDLLSGRMVVDFPRWTYHRRLDDIGLRQRSSGLARYEITDGDPLSAVTLTDYEVETEMGDVVIRHQSSGRLSCTSTTFRVEMSLRVHEGEALVFQRRWDEEIPRDMV